MNNCTTCSKLILGNQIKYISGGRYTLNICKDCFNIAQKAKRAREGNKYSGRYRERLKNWKLETKYGITLEEFNRKLETQLNGCAVCKEEFKDPNKIHVDHNHETGKVRDLLCTRCNFALGLVHEDEDFIWELLEYLKRHSEPDERSFESIVVNE